MQSKALRLLRLIALIGALLVPFSISFSTPAGKARFNGKQAFNYTAKITAFGERPSDSANLQRCRNWIISQLKPLRGKLTLDSFRGETPNGPVPMVNLIYKFAGSSGKAVVISGHYDTKRIAMVHFVGANDGGSSAGFLLELAQVLASQHHKDDIYLVFFDGEEAVGQWSDTDSRYGSRHLVAKWGAEGFLPQIEALINVDMIGDKDLDIMNDAQSSPTLRKLVWSTAASLGYSSNFKTQESGVDDDHIPFVDAGVNAIDLLDLDYGPQGSYWHTEKDTMDKLSAHSFQVVGDVVGEVIQKVENEAANT